jgi:hypothetical protein
MLSVKMAVIICPEANVLMDLVTVSVLQDAIPRFLSRRMYAVRI